jgi:hypothetical protein
MVIHKHAQLTNVDMTFNTAHEIFVTYIEAKRLPGRAYATKQKSVHHTYTTR